jgi:tetratricopeptide (TPR) repeat protein
LSSIVAIVYVPNRIAAQQPEGDQHQQLPGQHITKDNNPSILVRKGTDLLYNQANYTEAIRYFDKALAVDSNNLGAIFYKGAALDNLGNRTQSFNLIAKSLVLSGQILSTDPTNVDVLAIKGRAFNRLGNYTEAIRYFDKALAVDPSYKYALANKGLALSKLGNYTEAIRYFDKALAVDSRFVYALGSKGDALSNHGDYYPALKYFDEALSIYPNNIQLLTLKAIVFDHLTRYTEATTLIDRALHLDPNYTFALDNKALVLNHLKNYTEAIIYLDKALLINPNDSFAFTNKPVYLNQLKQHQQLPKNISSLPAVRQNNSQFTPLRKIPLADYTFMVYMIGSDLEAKSYAATQNIRQMEEVGSSSKVNIIIETGGGTNQTKIDGSDKRFIDFTKVQRHKILNNDIQTKSDLGKQNMGDPKTLSDFIVWGMSNFPAKKYAIILWDHGSGINGFGGDPQFNYDKLTIDEIHQAFASSLNNVIDEKDPNKFELVGFDSCLMASVEVANSISSFSNYMIASEEIEPPWGWDYFSVLRSLNLHPEQDGSLLGKSIADSYFKKSGIISLSQGFNAQKETTMSVIDLTKVAMLVDALNALAQSVDDKLIDLTSIVSFVRSVDASERYGLTSNGNSGLVDIYDLASNIVRRFPQLSNSVEIVQNSLKDTTIYKTNGEANPNAHGLSIYMPLKQAEFTDSRKYTLPDWQKIVDLQYNLTNGDNQSPIIQSSLSGDNIKGRIYANDVAKVTLWIYSSSMPEGNTVIHQDIDPSSFIKNDGSFEYKWNRKILSLCTNEIGKQSVCKPSIMNLEINREKSFASIPVRLKSPKDNVDERVSLKYEVNNDGNFTFLGARPEIGGGHGDQSQPVPKENWPLYPNDKVYPVVYSFTSKDQAISDLLQVEYDAMQVQHNNIFPRYISYNGTSDIFIRICDYNDNCWRTRWVHFNSTMSGLPEAVDLGKLRLAACKSLQIHDYSTYINSTYKFALQYPTNWQILETGNPDSTVVVFHSPDSRAQMYIDVEYWPGTYREFLDDVTPSKEFNPFSKTLKFNSTLLEGYPAYESIKQQKEVRTIDINTLVGHTWYTLTFMSNDMSKVSSFLETVKRMTDSFQLCNSKGSLDISQSSHRDNLSLPETINTQKFSKYTNPANKISIKYPSSWHINEDHTEGKIILSSPKLNSSFFKRDESVVGFLIRYDGNTSLLSRNNISLEQYSYYVIGNLKKALTGFHIYESRPIIFHGNSAFRATYSYFDPVSRSPVKETDITTIVNNREYYFDFFGELSWYQHYFPVIEYMLNSVEFRP